MNARFINIPNASFVIVAQFRVPLYQKNIPAIENFIGRNDELRRLAIALDQMICPRRKVIVLNGLGGTGESQLAIQYARLYRENYSAIILINCRDRATLMQSLASTVPQFHGSLNASDDPPEVSLEQRVRQVLDRLSLSQNSKWDEQETVNPKESHTQGN
jgi:hypothetical protein